MKILLLAPLLPPSFDGVGDHASRVASSLARKGHEVVVVTDRQTSHAQAEVVSVGDAWNWTATWRALRAFIANKPDLLLVEYAPFNFGPTSLTPHILSAAARLRGIPVGLFLHEAFPSPKNSRLFERLKVVIWTLRDLALIGMPNAVFTTSEERRRRLARRIGPLARKLHVVPIGAMIEPPADVVWSPPDGALHLVTFGVVVVRRRIELMIEMIALLSARGVEAELTVFGRIFDVAYFEQCKALASRLGVAERVHFRANVEPSDVTRLFMSAHAAVHAAREGVIASSSALLAALAHGVPVVAVATPHDESRFREVVALTEADPRMMAEEALVLAQGGERAMDLSRKGRAFYRDAFSWDDITRRALDALIPAARAEQQAGA
jgi:glycosyltransferase involved in cell wall biosynthesis